MRLDGRGTTFCIPMIFMLKIINVSVPADRTLLSSQGTMIRYAWGSLENCLVKLLKTPINA